MLAEIEELTHAVGISPPILKASMPRYRGTHAQFLFLGGDEDFAFEPKAFEECLKVFGDSATYQPLPGCDHFFRQREECVCQEIAKWLLEQLPES